MTSISFEELYKQSLMEDEEDSFSFEDLYKQSLAEEQQERKKKKKGVVADVVEQAGVGAAEGLFGTYGGLLSLLGLQSQRAEENLVSPSSVEERRQATIRSQDPERGFFDRIGDVISSTDEEKRIVGGLPTGADIKGMLEMGGVDTDAETMPGRYAHRISEFIGSGTSLGMPEPALSSLAGATGQSLEELEVSPLVQALAELGVFVAGGARRGLKAGQLAKASTQEGGELERGLRRVGTTEKGVQTAINVTEGKKNNLLKWMKGDAKTKEAFAEASKGFDMFFNENIEGAMPGITDIEKMEKEAIALYKKIPVVEKMKNKPFVESVEKVVTSLKKTLAQTPEQKKLIQLFDEAKSTVKSGIREKGVKASVSVSEEDKSDILKWVIGEAKTKEAFAEASKGFNKLFSKTIERAMTGIPDIEKIEKEAVSLYNTVPVVEEINPKPFVESVEKVVSSLKKISGDTPEQKKLIELFNGAKSAVKSAVKSAKKTVNPTSEYYINFYKSLNRLGDWANASQKEFALHAVKQGIKDSLSASGEKGVEAAEIFLRANKGIEKVYKAKDVMKILEPAILGDGSGAINMSKMNQILSNNKNFNNISKNLGVSETKALRSIASKGSEIEAVIKKLEDPKKATSMFNYGISASLMGAFISLNPKAILSSLGVLATKEASHRLASKMITDPKYQKLVLKVTKAAPNASFRELLRYQNEMIGLVNEYNAEEELD